MDAEAVVARKLMGATGVKAFLEVPPDPPSEFITVEQTGGATGALSRASLAIQAWAETRKRAREIASAVCDAVRDLDEEPNIFGPAVESVYRFPDPDSRMARYQVAASIRICE